MSTDETVHMTIQVIDELVILLTWRLDSVAAVLLLKLRLVVMTTPACA